MMMILNDDTPEILECNKSVKLTKEQASKWNKKTAKTIRKLIDNEYVDKKTLKYLIFLYDLMVTKMKSNGIDLTEREERKIQKIEEMIK